MANATAENLDFLDEDNVDEVTDPTKNDQPIYKRVFEGFYAGPVTFVEGQLKAGDSWKSVEAYFELPEDAVNSDGDDVIKFNFGLPKALKPAAMAFARMGIKNQDIKNGLLKATEATVAKMIKKLTGKTINVIQKPGAVKGKGGKRYAQQNVYTAKGWEAILAQFDGKVPTAEDLGVTVGAGAATAASEDEDLY